MNKRNYPVRIAPVRALLKLSLSSVQSQMVQRDSNALVVMLSSSITNEKIEV
jgi:hypothetical protein